MKETRQKWQCKHNLLFLWLWVQLGIGIPCLRKRNLIIRGFKKQDEQKSVGNKANRIHATAACSSGILRLNDEQINGSNWKPRSSIKVFTLHKDKDTFFPINYSDISYNLLAILVITFFSSYCKEYCSPSFLQMLSPWFYALIRSNRGIHNFLRGEISSLIVCSADILVENILASSDL